MENGKPLLIIGPSIQEHGIGGVTIHVRRLMDYLENNGFSFSFVDYKTTSPAKLIKAVRRVEVVHLHISNPGYQFCLVSVCSVLRKKFIVTSHGKYGRFSRFKNLLVRTSIRLSSAPIIINEKSFSICKHFNNKAQFIPAFIPPQKEECLSKPIIDYLDELRGKGKIIVSTNAFNVAFDKLGNDTYGIDFLVQFFESSEKMSLIVSDPSGNYKKRYSDLQSESVFFIDYPHPYFELLKHVDFCVRNTSTDGDALSVKEALFLGIPTLCTDVVDRPRGVRLFKYSDKESFALALNTPAEGKESIENGAEKILELYKRL